MSYDNHTPDSRVRSLIDRFSYPHLLTATLTLVAATILLGVAAKATGSGLACQANWPQCDAGPYNLFPANLPSFYEWFHRFVAMFAGFAIIGSALAAWRLPDVDRRVTGLVVLGMVLTPVQVALGRETVTQYTMDILSLHFWTAVTIFTLFLVATVLVWASRLTTTHVTGALALGIVALPAHVILSPVVDAGIETYSPTMQLIQYAVTLTLLGAAIVAAMVGRRRYTGRSVTPLLVGPPLVVSVLFFGRQAVNPALEMPYLVTAAALLVTFVVGMAVTRRQG
ncbi:cytochrome c oxidase assembly protein subunit 15 [Natrinema hispanicum]|uniref:Cytochrome c oxidase assembly protein subunit 15 n=1 Tax=Natrinema hispanicum TaxID=392421 RepID=A0A482YBF1_9EURY|nr:cytochrome oxidase assembly protein [Natrinema hispanicum]RZV10708.1 cytochrome c oxidase assembly protein subunit 15 [Natrinema hispanicum]